MAHAVWRVMEAILRAARFGRGSASAHAVSAHGAVLAHLAGLLALLAAAGELLAASAGPDYPPVRPGRAIASPADTGAHPEYRTEWWYVTGWITDEKGTERGFQVTFFRVRPRIGEDNPSRFAPRQIVLAHAAVADAQRGRLLHAERAARTTEPLAGVRTDRTHAWADDWFISLESELYRTRVVADDFAFELRLDPESPPMLNGRAGFSQKAPDPKHASYYYSRPQLAVSGTLRLQGATHRVTGHAWLDHEWSSEILPEEARGWDWIGINLHDGGALMAFQMRGTDGHALWTAGTLRAAKGEPRALSPEQVTFRPGRRWRSSRTSAEYPVQWEVIIDGRRMQLVPLMDDQELDSRRSTGAVYWEGAVRLIEDGREIGRGYLEMTGYSERLKM